MTTTEPDVEPGDDQRLERVALWIGRAISYLVYVYLVIVEIILFLGFLLHLFGANPDSSFVRWVYRNLESAMRPFRGMFQPIELNTASEVPATLETSVLFAMVMYGIAALVMASVLNWLRDRVTRLDNEKRHAEVLAAHERELQAIEDRAVIARAQVEAQRGAPTPGPAAAAVAPATPSAPLAPSSAQAPTPPPPPNP